MSKRIHFSIPEPCHESWDAMTKTYNGKFCGSCSKEVVDFSTMTDTQVLSYFKKPAGTVCGRFREEQLNHELVMPKKPLPWAKYFFSIALPAFLFSFKANAQTGKVKPNVDTVDLQNIDLPARLVGRMGFVATSPQIATIDTIKGQVLSATGEPIPHATVLLKGSKAATTTDLAGNFSLKNRRAETATIIVTAIGYDAKEIVVQSPYTIVTLPQNEGMALGIVVVTNIRRKPKTIPLLERIADTVFTKFKVYPNPVRSGSSVVVEWKKGEPGDYTANLVTIAGQLVHTKAVAIETKSQLVKLDLPVVVAGVYVLSFKNGKTGKVYSQQLIIQ